MAFVVRQLDIDDIYNLACSCRQFQYLIHEEAICKTALETMAATSAEAQAARASNKFAAGLRRLVKRRNAISSAEPFLVAIVAVAESFLYKDGVLSYLLGGQLRLLDLHHSARSEIVIDLQSLLYEVIDVTLDLEQDKVELLHCSDGILSCLYCQGQPVADCWLLAFSIQERRLLTAHPLESIYKIFVRNNEKYLYIGTHSEIGEDGYRRWVLEGYCVGSNEWFEQKINLLGLVGSDIGSSICFEIIDGEFLGLSSQTSFEVEEVDWTSFYHCLKFPLDHPKPKRTRITSKKAMWRRQHAEGVIDDRWTFLRILKDEGSGKIKVVESRKEWLAGQSSGGRSYYITDLDFPPDHDSLALASALAGEGSSSTSAQHLPSAKLLPPTITEAPQRSPYDTHRGDDASTSLLFTLSKCFIRSYHLPCQTFLDLVDDPPAGSTDIQRLRIRAGSRRLRPADELLDETSLSSMSTDDQLRALFRDDGRNQIRLWPPEQDVDRSDPFLEDLYQILNPPTHRGNIHGQWDDRSIVYATGGGDDDLQALVFLSFDPSIDLQGLTRWAELSSRDESANRVPQAATGSETGVKSEGDSKGTGKGRCEVPSEAPCSTTGDSSSTRTPANDNATAEAPHAKWVTTEPPLYGQISRGYCLAL